MEGDAVVALGRATVDGQTLFGHNRQGGTHPPPGLCRTAARAHALDDKVRTQYLELPQARCTYAVLASRPAGHWGYDCGLNEHQLAVGCLDLRPTLAPPGPGLLGTDLVRLTLERSRSARQAVDRLTNLVERQGQGAFPACPPEAACDHAFVLADPSEAYVVETAGNHWVYQQVREVRAASNVRVIRQDWDRISPGLADHAIGQGWWPADGSKLDFASALSEEPRQQARALGRWGRATWLLQEQNGHIDLAFLRRLAQVQAEGAVGKERSSRLGSGNAGRQAATAFLTALAAEPSHLPVAWWSPRVPGGIYFPLFVDGQLPGARAEACLESGSARCCERLALLSEHLLSQPHRVPEAREALERLQARFDQEADDFAAEGAGLRRQDAPAELERQVSLFMEHHLELFEEVVADLIGSRPLVAV